MRVGIAALWTALACAALPTAGWAQQPQQALDLAAQKPPAPQAPAKPVQPAKRKPQPVTVPAHRQPGRPGSFEVSAAANWLAPGSIGSSPARLTSNGSSTPFTYFNSSGRMGGAAAIDARVTYNVVRRLAVEGGFLFGRPAVNFTIAGDSEGAAGFTASGERLSQYFLDANVLVFLPKLTFARGRARAFVEGGGGYLRQLHAGNFNVDTGTVYNGGAGLKYYFKPRVKGLIKGFGLRVDLRTYFKRGGFSFDGGNTWTAALGGGALVAF